METENYMAPLPRYVRMSRYAEISGYTEKALEHKRLKGQWKEGREYIVAPDGRMMVDWQAADRWCRGEFIDEFDETGSGRYPKIGRYRVPG